MFFISCLALLSFIKLHKALMQLLKSLASIVEKFVAFVTMMQRNPVSKVVFIRMSDNLKST